MTTRQKEIIRDNLRAFVHNFGDVRIESAGYGGGFYIMIAPLKEQNGIAAPIDES